MAKKVFLLKMDKAVIIAGGKGTRLPSITKDKPKPLIKIGNKPVLEHQILILKEYGIKEIWLLLGYLGKQIEDYLGNGEKWGVEIHYHYEEKLLGTAGALKVLEDEIKEDFLVFSGDVMLNFDIDRFVEWHKKDSIASIIVHPNDHPFDSDLVEVSKKDRIVSLLRRPHPDDLIFHNLSISSVYIFSPEVFKYIKDPFEEKKDIEKDLLPLLLGSEEKIYAYKTPEYIKDMGTSKRLEEVRKDYSLGKIENSNLKNKKKAVFLDRDGVINKERENHVCNLSQLEIYDFVPEAIRKINEKGYLVIIITNQAGIAKGFMNENDLDKIHKKIETELGSKGAKVDAIYYCPHHPEKGFKGEVKELKVDCKCRKPKAGMLLKAKEDFNIDFDKSYFVGDRTADILAGEKVGCKTILVKTGYRGEDNKYKVKPDFLTENLLSSIDLID